MRVEVARDASNPSRMQSMRLTHMQKAKMQACETYEKRGCHFNNLSIECEVKKESDSTRSDVEKKV